MGPRCLIPQISGSARFFRHQKFFVVDECSIPLSNFFRSIEPE